MATIFSRTISQIELKQFNLLPVDEQVANGIDPDIMAYCLLPLCCTFGNYGIYVVALTRPHECADFRYVDFFFFFFLQIFRLIDCVGV